MTNSSAVHISDQAKRFKIYRERKKLTQPEFGELIQVKSPVISKYERGHIVIPARHIKKLKEIFGLSYEWFYNGIGPMDVKEDKEKSTLIKDIGTLHTKYDILENRVKKMEADFYKIMKDFYADKHGV